MTDQPRLLEAHRRIKEASRPGGRPEPSAVPADAGEPPWTMMAGYLVMRGWEYRVRMGQRIWRKEDESDVAGYRGWYGEATAYLWAEREERGEV